MSLCDAASHLFGRRTHLLGGGHPCPGSSIALAHDAGRPGRSRMAAAAPLPCNCGAAGERNEHARLSGLASGVRRDHALDQHGGAARIRRHAPAGGHQPSRAHGDPRHAGPHQRGLRRVGPADRSVAGGRGGPGDGLQAQRLHPRHLGAVDLGRQPAVVRGPEAPRPQGRRLRHSGRARLRRRRRRPQAPRHQEEDRGDGALLSIHRAAHARRAGRARLRDRPLQPHARQEPRLLFHPHRARHDRGHQVDRRPRHRGDRAVRRQPADGASSPTRPSAGSTSRSSASTSRPTGTPAA